MGAIMAAKRYLKTASWMGVRKNEEKTSVENSTTMTVSSGSTGLFTSWQGTSIKATTLSTQESESGSEEGADNEGDKAFLS